jgi:hypothetical protein
MNYKHSNEIFMKIKVSEFFAFMKQILDSVKAETKMPVCKVVDWDETAGGSVNLTVQISGTRGITTYRPSEILKDHKLLRQFDQLDVVVIKNFDTYETLKPKYKISEIDFLDGKTVKITKIDGEEKEYHVNDFKKNYSLLSELNQSDSFIIGRMVGRTEFDINN